MKINPIHSFDLSLDEMRAIQHSLRQQIRLTPYLGQPRLVAGVDLAYFPDNQQAVAVIAIMDYASKQLVETVHCQDTVSQEYIPGFLAFRELPLFLKAWEQVQSEPDLVFFDGNGMLHPERVGLATHASFFIDKPTIGIAKKHFMGEYREPGPERGSMERIWDQGEIIGAVLRTQDGVKPIYVSVGNHVDLPLSLRLALHFVGKESRIPEIIRRADMLTRQIRKQMLDSLESQK
ncbi:endonuclease V [Laceyella putida]|uniref:Endonuclease V n=1 Tax=Laceyella putida TaxID=110101 RepID=A0ABW2RNL3_9BACL